MTQETGKYLIAGGIILLLIGVAVYFFHDQLKWFGNMPGDIKGRSGSTRFYFPIVTMLIVSIILTIIVNVIRKFF